MFLLAKPLRFETFSGSCVVRLTEEWLMAIFDNGNGQSGELSDHFTNLSELSYGWWLQSCSHKYHKNTRWVEWFTQIHNPDESGMNLLSGVGNSNTSVYIIDRTSTSYGFSIQFHVDVHPTPSSSTELFKNLFRFGEVRSQRVNHQSSQRSKEPTRNEKSKGALTFVAWSSRTNEFK